MTAFAAASAERRAAPPRGVFFATDGNLWAGREGVHFGPRLSQSASALAPATANVYQIRTDRPENLR
jgi:hypothetical protein